jgi:hypothetical protein
MSTSRFVDVDAIVAIKTVEPSILILITASLSDNAEVYPWETPPVPVTSASLPLDSQHASPLTVGIDDTASAGHDDPSLSDVARKQPWMPKGMANQLQASESTGTVAITITTLIDDDMTGNQTWWS